jgi:hypothetical protein
LIRQLDMFKPTGTTMQALPCMHTGVATPDMLARLAAERDRIQVRLTELTETRDRLDAVITAARDTGHDCS